MTSSSHIYHRNHTKYFIMRLELRRTMVGGHVIHNHSLPARSEQTQFTSSMAQSIRPAPSAIDPAIPCKYTGWRCLSRYMKYLLTIADLLNKLPAGRCSCIRTNTPARPQQPTLRYVSTLLCPGYKPSHSSPKPPCEPCHAIVCTPYGGMGFVYEHLSNPKSPTTARNGRRQFS